MHSQYLVDAAQKCGVDVKRLVLKSDELPLYQSILKEVERWMEEWENKINVVEQLARAEFLLWPWVLTKWASTLVKYQLTLCQFT